MKSPKVRHATHHFLWQKKNTICICWLKDFKNHYTKITHVHCNYAYSTYICKVYRYVFFLKWVCIWANLAEMFCSWCPSWTLVGRFHSPTLRSHTCSCSLPILGHRISVPQLYRTNKRFTTEKHLNLPKYSFHCAYPVTSELWPVYVDENVNNP